MCPRDDFSTSIIDARGTIRDRNSRLVHGAVSIRERIIRGELEASRLPEGVKVAEVSAETVAAYDPDGLLLVNVNTPHDYERAKQVLEGRSKTSRDRIMDELGP